jgi:hypothetical protein
MSELATVDHFLLYATLIVLGMATMQWFESRRLGVLARRRRRDRAR